MNCSTDPIKKILAETDCVWGVWIDPLADSGFDAMILKGRYQDDGRASAIPCRSESHALALRNGITPQA